jgi:sugar lactone lactonase YvrE
MKTKITLLAAAGAALLALTGAPVASADYAFLGQWSSDATVDVATSADASRVYVVHGFGTPPDDGRGIEVFDTDGHQLARWGNTDQSIRFIQPHELERGADGKLYLLDTGDVKVLDPGTGDELRSFDVNGSFPVLPTDLTTAPDGSFYVFHQGYQNGPNHPDNRPPQVAHYSADGTELQRWGESGDGDGQFHLGAAQSIAVTPDGSVLVADSWQKRIQRFSPDGKFREAWSSLGACTGNDELLRAWDVAADSSGGAYIASFDSRIVHFGSDGSADEVIGIRGSNPGQFVFPGTLDVATDGALTVNDQYNDRIQRFRHVPDSPGCGGGSGGGGAGSGSGDGGSGSGSGDGGAGSGRDSPGTQFGVVGVGDITPPSLGLTPYQRGGIRDLAFDATCSEECTVTAAPRATIEVGRRSRTVDLPAVTRTVPAGTQGHVALAPSDELVAAMYQALTTRGGKASVRVDVKAADAAGNVGTGSVDIRLAYGR